MIVFLWHRWTEPRSTRSLPLRKSRTFKESSSCWTTTSATTASSSSWSARSRSKIFSTLSLRRNSRRAHGRDSSVKLWTQLFHATRLVLFIDIKVSARWKITRKNTSMRPLGLVWVIGLDSSYSQAKLTYGSIVLAFARISALPAKHNSHSARLCTLKFKDLRHSLKPKRRKNFSCSIFTENL